MLGLGTLARKVFGTPNDRRVKSLRPLVDKINALEPEFRALDDAGLKAKTDEFRERFTTTARASTTCCPRPSPTPARPPAAPSACAPSTCSWSAESSCTRATSPR